MDKIVNKLYFAWQLDKEKKFLEDMAKQGYKLKKVRFGKYIFEEIEPTNLVYQFDFQIIGKDQVDEYLSLFSDWEVCATYGSWYYFCKENPTNEELSIFNDNKSKTEMFRKLIMFLIIIAIPLYYQLIIFYPNMDESEFTFPKFYFFIRIVVILLVILHSYAVLRIIHSIKKISKSISE